MINKLIMSILITVITVSCGSLTDLDNAGEVGDQGERGEKGEIGNNGKDGINGNNGKDGERGEAGFKISITSSEGEIIGYVVDMVGFKGDKKYKFVTEEGYWGVADLKNDKILLLDNLQEKYDCLYAEADCSGACYAWVSQYSDHTGVIISGLDGYFVAEESNQEADVVLKSYIDSGSCINFDDFTTNVREASRVDKFSDFPYKLNFNSY